MGLSKYVCVCTFLMRMRIFNLILSLRVCNSSSNVHLQFQFPFAVTSAIKEFYVFCLLQAFLIQLQNDIH